MSRLKAATTPQLHLVVAFILGLLASDVRPHHHLVEPDSGDEITAGPKVLAGEIALPATVFPGNLNGALVLEVAHDIRDGVLGRDADAHVGVICHEMLLNDFGFLVLGYFVQHLTELPS